MIHTTAIGPLRRRRRGIVLTELLALVAIIIFVLIALTRLLVGQLDLHAIERQHHNRVAAMDGLLARLRGDLIAAQACEWIEGDKALLIIGRAGAAGPARIRYEFAAGHVSRTILDAPESQEESIGVPPAQHLSPELQTDAWSSSRLQFAAELERGPRGALLRLSFIEQPPPRRRRMPDRTYDAVLLLPNMKSAAEELP